MATINKTSKEKVKEKGKTPKQAKLTDFGASGAPQQASDAAEVSNTGDATAEVTLTRSVKPLDRDEVSAILAAIDGLRTEFSSKVEGIMSVLTEIRKELTDCTEQVVQAELRIAAVEDDLAKLNAKVLTLEKKNAMLEGKVLDLEMRSRRNNLRMVGLPEGAEGSDACTFLENWIQEVTEVENRVVIERAHRVGPKKDANAPPRTLIMRFLNDRDRHMVLQAIRTKRNIFYKKQQVRFYPDLAEGVLKQRREFDSVRQQLRDLGIRHGVMIPARLIVTVNGETRIFNTPTEAQVFTERIKEGKGDHARQ
ncbi:hypothetical protein NFI96_008911 [Prochilodus magdalenae]|nr:hypothetical protein NFI96_008911 [Prochilodus magdalenae]